MSIKGTAEQIADELRAEIESGAMRPGSPLNQVAIAERFGLSRIPVREALRQLEAQGYVTYRPNKGAAVITELPPRDVLEILEIRECLELRLMEIALEGFTSAVLERAAEALQTMNRARTEAEVVGSHGRFHAILFEAAARPRMSGLVSDWRFGLHRAAGPNTAMKRSYIRATRDLHKRLLRGCAQHDHAAVSACVREEYAFVRRLVT